VRQVDRAVQRPSSCCTKNCWPFGGSTVAPTQDAAGSELANSIRASKALGRAAALSQGAHLGLATGLEIKLGPGLHAGGGRGGMDGQPLLEDCQAAVGNSSKDVD
jgi:hypothetical protein